MALNINAGDVKRGDLFLVSPENLIVDFASNGRKTLVPEVEVLSLAKSIMVLGQLQPVSVRRVAPDNHLQLSAGYTRYRAIQMINTKLDPGNPRRISCKVSDGNEKDSFMANVAENQRRNATTLLDDAYNQKRMREEFGMTDVEISEFYDCSVPWVSRVRGILGLIPDIQKAIGDHSLKGSTALTFIGLSEDDQKSAFAAALAATPQEKDAPKTLDWTPGVTTPTKIKGSAVTQAVRNQKLASGNGSVGRSMREVRKFFEAQMENEAFKEFSKKMLDFIAGKITEKQAENALTKLAKVE